MTTETTVEMKFCSGCRMPGCMIRRLIPMQHGYICEVCVNVSTKQVMLAARCERELERVHRLLAHIQDLSMPGESLWWMESDVSRLEVLVTQLRRLASDYVYRTGPFAEDVAARPEEPTSNVADVVSQRPTIDVPVLRLAPPHIEAVPASPPAVQAAEDRIYAVACDVLNAELLDWPMRESLKRHGVDDMQTKLGLQEMLDELRGHRDFLETRPQLTLVRLPDEEPPTPEFGALAVSPPPSSAPDRVEHPAVPDQAEIGVEQRSWIERLEFWMQNAGLSPEVLARRARRGRATVVDLLGRKDRRMSLRLFLDLVRDAGARLSGVPESTPRALLRRLKDLLSKQGLAITTLARRSGIHRSQLSTLFNSPDPNPCVLTIQRIVDALDAESEVNLVALEQGHTAQCGEG